jgi:hypothetical protein
MDVHQKLVLDMKKKVTQKLAAYSALAAGALAAVPGNAQIVYHDVDPDGQYNNDSDSLWIDINADGIDDFFMWVNNNATVASVRIYPEPGNEVLGSLGYGGAYFYPFALNANDMISSGQAVWNGTINGAAFTMAWNYLTGGSYGNWFGATDKYLGFSIIVGTNLHYGWIRLDVPANGGGFTIKDWAYNSQSDAAIYANQMQSIEEPAELEANIYAYNSVLNFNTPQQITGTISVVNMMGQTVKEVEITDAQMEIDLSSFDSGIYMVNVTSEEGTFTKKIAL